MRYDVANYVTPKPAFDTDGLTDAATSTVIDLSGYSSVALALMLGDLTTAGTGEVTFEHSDTGAFGGEEVAVPADQITGKTTFVQAEDANSVMKMGYIGSKRYVQATIDLGTITVADGAGVWVLGSLDRSSQDRIPSDVLPTG
jgi:hypothetical protein